MTFKKYAKYYDALYKGKDYDKEAEFILKTLKRDNFSGNKILSLGCGTCSYEVILAKKGYDITGVDVSKEMLSIAAEKIKQAGVKNKINLIQGDVRKLNFKTKFDVVMCMFNVIGYQNTNEDMDMMLSGVSRLLKKGGVFFFDCWHTPAVVTDPPTKRTRTIKIDGETIIRKTTPQLHLDDDLLDITFDVKEYKNKKVLGKTSEKHTMRFFSIPELKYFLSKNNLETTGVYNFMDFNSKVNGKKWDIFLTSRKK